MNQLELGVESPVENQLKSMYNTLQRYHRTSMALHNRSVPAVAALARLLETRVDAIVQDHPNHPRVVKWASKFYALMGDIGVGLNTD